MPTFRQVVGGRQPGLPAADDDGLDPFGGAVHRCLPRVVVEKEPRDR